MQRDVNYVGMGTGSAADVAWLGRGVGPGSLIIPAGVLVPPSDARGDATAAPVTQSGFRVGSGCSARRYLEVSIQLTRFA